MREKWFAAAVSAAVLAFALPAIAQTEEAAATDWPLALRGPTTRVGTIAPPSEPMFEEQQTSTSDWPLAVRGPSTHVSGPGDEAAQIRTVPRTAGSTHLQHPPPLRESGVKRASSQGQRRVGSHGQKTHRRHRKIRKH